MHCNKPGSTDASQEAVTFLGRANFYPVTGERMKKPKNKLWIHQDPSVRLPYMLIKSNAYRRLPAIAQTVYTLMRATAFNGGPHINNDPRCTRFGPEDVQGYISKVGYYQAIKALQQAGIIRQVESGGHGRKAVFDLTILDWIDVEPGTKIRPYRD